MGIENNIPEGWMETTLGVVAVIGSSKRIFFSEYVDKGIPFYRSKEIIQKQKGNNISTKLFITEEKYDNLKNNFGAPQENDILLTSVGTLGIPYRVRKNEIFYFKDGNLTWFRDYQNIESAFLYNWFLSSTGKHQLNKITIGSTQSALTISGLKSIEILLPPINEQIEITNIINAFDDKIELLQAQNKTLETMAQTIFKEWFGKYQIGDVLPEGWREYELGDVCNLSAGGDKPKNSTSKSEGENIIPIYSNGIKNEGLYGFTNNASIFDESVTVSARGTIGYVCLRPIPYVPIVRLVSVIPDKNYLSAKFLFYFLKNNQILGTGTTQQQLTIPDFKLTRIIIPNSRLMDDFTKIINTFYIKIYSNKNQIQSLTKTRDTLLPKLMSGQVRVNSLKQTTNA